MIERKDYLLSQIELIGVLLSKLRKGRTSPLHQNQIRVEIDECLNIFNLTYSMLTDFPPETIIETVRNKKNIGVLSEIVGSILLWDHNASLVSLLKSLKEYMNTHELRNTTYYID